MEVPTLQEKSLHLQRALTSKNVGIYLRFLYVAHFCNVIYLCLNFKLLASILWKLCPRQKSTVKIYKGQ